MSMVSTKVRFRDVIFSHTYLVKTLSEVKLGELGSLA